MAETIKGDTKREGQRKAKRCGTFRNQKQRRASPSCGRKLFHPQPFLCCLHANLIVMEGLKQHGLKWVNLPLPKAIPAYTLSNDSVFYI